MISRNHSLSLMPKNYLFAEMQKRRQQYLEKFPYAKLISLGIGDTTQPFPQTVCNSLKSAIDALSKTNTYTGYEPYQGRQELRLAISQRIYNGLIDGSEVFISDGAKSALGRLQLLFPQETVVAVQDPCYPVYVDTTLATGKSKIVYMPCNQQNDFFPRIEQLPKADIYFICAPNNPTGTMPSRNKLEDLVQYALNHHALIVYDTAYAAFIRSDSVPKSIYEIQNADKVAIEVGSLSKSAGFSGLRLGWTVVPHALCYKDGSSVHADWLQVHQTFFNGASNLAQSGGMAVFSDEGWQASHDIIQYYMQNADILINALCAAGYSVSGGEYAPYIWMKTDYNSWDAFEYFLNDKQIIVTPGSGFGPSGEGYVRLSALGRREDVEEAARRLSQ